MPPSAIGCQGKDHANVADRARRDAGPMLMPREPSSPPDPGRETLMVWLKLVVLLIGLGVFGWVVFLLTRSLS